MKKASLTLALAIGLAAGATAAEEWEGIQIMPGVQLGVLIEVEANYDKQGDEKDSDLAVATFEASLEVAPVDGVRGVATLLWEQGGDLEVDEAIIELGGTDAFPLVLSAGRMYLPFGAFDGLMVSDPLTLELGETRQTAVGLSGEWNGFTVWAGAFAGELNDANKIENAALALSWQPAEWLSLGVSGLSDLGEGAGYQDDLNVILAAEGSRSKAAGVSAFLRLDLDPVTVSVEYLGAVKRLEWTDAEGEVEAERPEAWFADVAWAFAGDWSAALRYEGSRNFKPGEMPEHQAGAALFWSLNSFATLGAEYLFGTFEGEDADDRHLVTIQLALEF